MTITFRSRSSKGRVERVVFAVVTLAAALLLLNFLPRPTVLNDTWGHLAIGKLLVESGSIPRSDPFTYMPSRDPWVFHWLSETLMYLVLQSFGVTGLLVLRAGLWLAACTFAWAAARLHGASGPLALAVLLFVAKPTAGGFAFFRPQAFTYTLFALELCVLAWLRHGTWRRALWLIPLMVLWANLHGGVLAGLGVLWLYVGGRVVSAALSDVSERQPILPLCLVATGASAATLLNPWGIEYFAALSAEVTASHAHIIEWRSVLVLPRPLQGMLGTLALAMVAALLFTDLRRHPSAWLIVLATTVMGARHIRHIPFFGIALAALLPGPVTRAIEPAIRRRWDAMSSSARRVAAVAAIVVASSVVALAAREASTPGRWRPRVVARYTSRTLPYPFGAVEFIRVNGLAGNLATPFAWGQFVSWKLYPRCRVSFDARYALVYGETVMEDNWNFLFGKPGWERLLTEYPTDMVLVENGVPAFRLMRARRDWRMIYQDDLSAVFVPNRPEHDREWIMPKRVRGSFP